LNGAVAHDTEVLGGQIHVNGEIGGDLRIAAGEIDLNGTVLGDLVVAGGQVRVHPGASIDGDVLLAGGEVLLEGDLRKSLKAAGGDVTLNGRVGGPVRLRAGRVVIGERANLESELTYFAPDEAEIREGARIAGPVNFFVVSGMDQNWFQRGVRRLNFAFYSLGLLMTLAAGVLACIFLRRLSQGLVAYALPNFGKELLRGFVLFLVVPAAIFLMFVTVIGAPLAFVTGMMHLAFGMIAIVFTGIAEGALLRKRVQKKEQYEVNWKTALLGIPLAFLVSLIPIAGFLFNATFFLVVFGSLYERFWVLIRSSA
jgi:cytoskeletal protein CcmA (bactofilin family)